MDLMTNKVAIETGSSSGIGRATAICYKLIATSRTSRPKVHELYHRLGFTQHGVEFRIDF